MSSSPKEFRFAHLSDIHLGPLPSVTFRDLLSKRITGWMNWNWGRGSKFSAETLNCLLEDLRDISPDHIVCSGDICNLSLPAEWPRARSFLEQLGPPEQITFVPGNHDAYVPGALSGLMRQLGAYAAPSFPCLHIRENIAFIGLSSAIPTPLFFATGELGTQQITALGSLLDDLSHSAFIKVIVLHHPPTFPLAKSRRGLNDFKELQRLFQEYDVDLVLYGHNHHAHISFTNGKNKKIPLIGAPSLSLQSPDVQKKPGYHIITTKMNEHRSIHATIETRIWTPKGIECKTVIVKEETISS